MNYSTSNSYGQQQQQFDVPLFKRAQEMAKGKNKDELEQIAKNICEQKEINYEEAYKAFFQMLK